MKKSVGLVVIVAATKGDDPRSILVAILQRRGTWNTEKNVHESYPGCLQVTCHGKLEDGEDYPTALLREIQEELGPNFAGHVMAVGPREVHRETTTEKEVVTYVVGLSLGDLRLIRLGPDSGGLELIPGDEIDTIDPINESMKELGPLYCQRAMFPDEIVAVKKAFEVYGQK